MRTTDAGALRAREAYDKRTTAHQEKQRKAQVKRTLEHAEQKKWRMLQVAKKEHNDVIEGEQRARQEMEEQRKLEKEREEHIRAEERKDQLRLLQVRAA